eukprot:jgi/Chrzof1/11486/UNPLg00418.t1
MPSAVDMQGSAYNYTQFQHYFNCAQQIEQQIVNITGRQVFWFLLCDAKAMRRWAKDTFGNKVVSAEDIVVEHVDLGAKHGNTGLIAAAGEMWINSLADYHIISRPSTFGRVGAMLSASWDNICVLEPYDTATKSCSLDAYTPFNQVVEQFIGVK